MAELFDENRFEEQIDSKIKTVIVNDFKQPETYKAEVLRQDSEGRWWVRFEGTDDETPIMVNKIDMRVGDIVTVTVKDHQSIADGNLTSPALSAANTYGYVDRVIADVIKASEAEIGYLKADVATIGYAQIQDADITNARIQNLVYEVTTNTNHLTAVDADILELQTNSLTANSAVITNLQAQTAKVQNLTAEDLEASVAYIDDLSAGNVTAADIIADHAEVSDLDANYAHITDGVIDNATIGYADVDGLDANYAHITNGAIDNATIGHAHVSGLSANYAHVSNGVIDNASIGHANVNGLSANYAHVSNGVIDNAKIGHADVNGLSANYAHVSNGVIDNAKIGHADVNGLSANYAEIDMANVNNTWIQNGTVKNAAITNEMVQSVSANKLTAGTIDASVITVTNLQADNIKVSKINGQTVTGKSIADALEQHESDITDLDDKIDTQVEALNDRIDGAIESHTGTAVPSLQNSPASSWNTTDLKDEHVGDVYYVVNDQIPQNGYCYRFTKSGTGASATYSWQLIKDSDVTAALSRLQTAEGKIGNIEAFDVTMSTFKTDTEGAISTLQTKTSTLETSLGDKVDTTTFNELSQTVEGNGSTITTLSTVLTNNGLTTSTNISNTVNSVQQTANTNSSSITSLTTTTQQLRTDLDNIEVGARNLLRWTAQPVAATHAWNTAPELTDGWSKWNGAWTVTDTDSGIKGTKSGSGQSGFTIPLAYEDAVIGGEKYTLSFDYRTNLTSLGSIYLLVASGSNVLASSNPLTTSDTDWQHYEQTITWPSSSHAVTRALLLPYTSTSGGWLEIKDRSMKLEKGNHATDWSPAPEDLESDFTAFKTTTTSKFNNVDQTLEGIETSIGEIEETVATKADGSTVTTLSSTVNQISQTATSNSSKLSQLTTTLGTNADGTTKTGDIVHRTSAVEQDLSGFKSTVSSTYATVASIGSLEAPYTEVEWVESDGTQYVYLDWKPPIATWGFEADFIIRNTFNTTQAAWRADTNSSNAGFLFGTRNGSGVNDTEFGAYSTTGFLRIGNSTNQLASGDMITDRTSRQTVKLIGNTLTRAAGTTKTLTRVSETADKPYANMTVFAYHDGLRRSGTGNLLYPSTSRVYSLKFYDGDELKVDLVGAVRNRDRMTGLYDKVKGHFYPAKDLLCGNEIGALGEPDTISKALDKQNISVSIDNRLISRMWEAEVPTLDRLDDGQQITVVFSTGVGGSTPNAIVAAGYDDFTGWDEGASTSYSSVYLKLTLSDGSNTGWIPCYYGQGARLTSHYGSGMPVLMTYRENVLYNATTTSAGTAVMRAWYADPNYVDGNTTYTKYSDAVIAGKNGLKPYTLCMKDDAGNWTTIVNQAATGLNDKTCYTGGLQLGGITYHITNGTYAAGANGGQLWESYGGIDFRRDVNGITDNASTTTLQLRKPVYFVGTLDDDDGLFYLDTTKWWTQDSFTTGKVYVLVGHAYTSNNAIFLAANNPSYIWNGTKLVEFSYSRIVQAETKIVQTDSSILSLAQANTTWTAPDGTTQTNQTAAKLQLKANKDTLTSEINASADTVQIDASRVNIAGAAIFTSGRLSTSSLNNAYDAKGAASTAEANAKNYVDTMEIGSRNLLLETPITYVTGNYEAYKLAFNDPLEIGKKYTVQLWDVDVSHTGKTAAQLGVFVYIGGGSCNTGVNWQGTSYFTNGHADHLTGTFTYSQSMHDASGGTNKWLSLYNSVPSASGTLTMSIGKWKLEKGSKATDWTPAPEDLASASDAVEYIVGTQGEATGSWTGVTKETSLVAGKTIAYKLPYAGYGNASLQLKDSSGNNVGGNNPVFSMTTRVTTHYPAGSIIQMTFDGNNWRTAGWYNTNNYDRHQIANAVRVAENYSAYVIGGYSGSGYKKIAANLEIDLSHPVAYLNQGNASNQTYAVASGGTSTNFYTAIPSVNVRTTNGVSNWTGTQYAPLYLKGTMNGNTFKVHSDMFTTTVPSSTDNCVYMYVGLMYSTYQVNFDSHADLYAFLDGKFRQVTPTEIVATQRIYWRTDTVGIPTAPNNTWVDEDDNVYKSWTTKVPPMAENLRGTVRYPYLYTCEQRKRLDGSVNCTQVLLDENTTIIDGGSIITNSIAANKLDIADVITVGGIARQDDVDELDQYVHGEYYSLTEDSTVQAGKTYYEKVAGFNIVPCEVPVGEDVTGLYEESGTTYVLTSDTVAQAGKQYFAREEFESYEVSSASVGSNVADIYGGLYELFNLDTRVNGLGDKYDDVDGRYSEVQSLYEGIDDTLNDSQNGVLTRLDGVDENINTLDGQYESLDRDLTRLDGDVKSVLTIASDSITIGKISNGVYSGCRAVLTSDSVDFVNSNGEVVSSYGEKSQIGRLSETHIEASGDYLLFMPKGVSAQNYDMSIDAQRDAVLQNAVAYIAIDSEGKSVFYMNRSVVVDDMFLGEGKWKFYKRENNNLSLKWMGAI